MLKKVLIGIGLVFAIMVLTQKGSKSRKVLSKAYKFVLHSFKDELTIESDTSRLIFEHDFENTIISRDGIQNGWEALKEAPQFRWQHFAWSGNENHVKAFLKSDNGRKVLYAEVIDDDPLEDGQSRFQWSIFLNEKLDILHFQYRIYLSPDIAELNNYPESIRWFSIFELWNEGAKEMDGGFGSARWNLNIHKDENTKLFWAWESEYMQPDSLMFRALYPDQHNYEAEIPLGKWFTLDINFNRNGRTIVKADSVKIFDFLGQNQYPGRPDLYPAYEGNAVNVFKLYTSTDILDWMKKRNKRIFAMYNDFKWYKW